MWRWATGLDNAALKSRNPCKKRPTVHFLSNGNKDQRCTYQSKTLRFWYRLSVDCSEGVGPEKLEICGVDQGQIESKCYKIYLTFKY